MLAPIAAYGGTAAIEQTDPQYDAFFEFTSADGTGLMSVFSSPKGCATGQAYITQGVGELEIWKTLINGEVVYDRSLAGKTDEAT